MAKQIPFRCKFGHVTILSFSGPTPSVIECEKCKDENTHKIIKYDHPYHDKNYLYIWPSRKLEMSYRGTERAVRI